MADLISLPSCVNSRPARKRASLKTARTAADTASRRRQLCFFKRCRAWGPTVRIMFAPRRPPVPAEPVHRLRQPGTGAAKRQRRHRRLSRRNGGIAGDAGDAHDPVVLLEERDQRVVIDRPVVGQPSKLRTRKSEGCRRGKCAVYITVPPPMPLKSACPRFESCCTTIQIAQTAAAAVIGFTLWRCLQSARARTWSEHRCFWPRATRRRRHARKGCGDGDPRRDPHHAALRSPAG
jgi:hypothetical protein